jgi:hypothetical protein
MDWPGGADRPDFLGFAILRAPGFAKGEKDAWLTNKIGFAPPASWEREDGFVMQASEKPAQKRPDSSIGASAMMSSLNSASRQHQVAASDDDANWRDKKLVYTLLRPARKARSNRRLFNVLISQCAY